MKIAKAYLRNKNHQQKVMNKIRRGERDVLWDWELDKLRIVTDTIAKKELHKLGVIVNTPKHWNCDARAWVKQYRTGISVAKNNSVYDDYMDEIGLHPKYRNGKKVETLY